jgi:hypothetical protein
MIKEILLDIPYDPMEDDNKLGFKFKKPGHNKLLLFDLDETLIHLRRETDDPD